MSTVSSSFSSHSTFRNLVITVHCKSCCTCENLSSPSPLPLLFLSSPSSKSLIVVFVLRQDKILYAIWTASREVHLITSHVLQWLPADKSHHTYRITWISTELRYWHCANIKQSKTIYLFFKPIGKMDNICLFWASTSMRFSKTLKCNYSVQVKQFQCVLQEK